MRAALVTTVVLASAVAQATPRQDLDRAVRVYRAGDWQSAIEVVTPLLYPHTQFSSQDDVIEARVLLGAANFQAGNKDRAVEEFKRAILLDPDRELAPLLFTDGVIKLYDQTKDELKTRLEHEAEKKRLAEAAARLEAYRKSLRVYETRPFYLNFMPFGLGQFTQGRNGMGAVMALGQGSTFLASVGIFGYLVGTYGFESNAVPIVNGPRVRRLQQIEIGTGIGFFAFYAWGVYDAIRHYKPRQQIQGDDSLIPPEILNPTKTKPAKTSFRLAPMFTPESVGIGIGWEN